MYQHKYDYLQTDEDKRISHRIIVTGNQRVGKSSLLTRLSKGIFVDYYFPTIGVDFITKLINYEGKHIKLELWDLAGARQYESIVDTYYTNADMCIIMFDVTNKTWKQEIKYYYDKISNDLNCRIIIVGNKSDLLDKQFSDREINDFVSHITDVPYFEISCKSNKRIDELINNIVHSLFAIKKFSIHKDDIVESPDNEEKISKDCCCVLM
jgi:small GTP-binding protein